MEIVINRKFGDYGISALATKELAKLKGRDCYFFKLKISENEKYKPISLEETEDVFIWVAYSVPNPNDFRLNEPDEDGLYKSANKRADEISLSDIANDRSDKDLISVIKNLGEKANTRFSELKVVEIPDDVEWYIDEYDGIEVINETRSWF